MKNILILGAGLMQRPSIEAAKKLGFRACVVDGNPNAICAKEADEFSPIDLKDREGLLEYAKKLNTPVPGGLEGGGASGNLVAVFTAGTDFSASVAYITEKLGLKGHSFEAALNASDKIRMRTCFKKAGVPSPKFVEISNTSDIEVATRVAEPVEAFPKVIKPCDNMGARGCRMIRNASEAASAITDAISFSRTKRAILEDYMDGPEFSIDAIVCNGNLTITGFADRHIFYPPYFIEIGHTMPSNVDEKIKNELVATFALGIAALGLTHGVAKADIKYTKNGPMIGEIAARLSGGYMSGWTFPLSSDFPLTEEALRVALDGEGELLKKTRVPLPWTPHETVSDKKQPFNLFEIKCKRYCAERAWMSIDGVVKEQYFLKSDGGRATVDFSSSDILILPRVKSGDKVNFPRNNVEKCGNVIAVGKTYEDAEKKAFDVVENIVIELEKNNEMTENYLRRDFSLESFPPVAFESEVSFDFNHRTKEKTLELYEKITGETAPTSDDETLKLAGLQGILYKKR